MANEEHVAILRQGVEVWNQWREENNDIVPRLSYEDLHHADLSGVNLFNTWLNGTDLSRANLSGAQLGYTDLSEAILSGVNLSKALLGKANLSGANLSMANLSGANLSDALLGGADLSRADLRDADLRRADLNHADLNHADLTRALLGEANLSKANLYWVSLHHVDLSGAKLTETNLTETFLSQTTFGNIDLTQVKGLETVKQYGPSTIGIDTIYRSGGNIPEAFLRGAGVPDTFITFMKSLTGHAFDFYSCFISHSSKDREFVERLYADLQSNKVRCWYAPEDLKIGEHFPQSIDKSIRLHDKLLLVLSENSVSSGWVQDEVLSAMEKEQGREPWVLFPIRLDDAVMETDVFWANKIRRSRHIGDFTQWKDHDNYKKAFDRLLRDLKSKS